MKNWLNNSWKKFIPFSEKTKKNEERKTHNLKKKQQLLLKSRLLYDITANFIWQSNH